MDAEVAPRGATTFLVTGDKNVGQVNEVGFINCVKLALKKGQYAKVCESERGLSRACKCGSRYRCGMATRNIHWRCVRASWARTDDWRYVLSQPLCRKGCIAPRSRYRLAQ